MQKPSSKNSLPDTALGFCAGYTVYTKFLESVFQVFQQPTRLGWLISTISGPAMMDARRDVVLGFLETPAKYLFMVDTDIEFAPEDLERLYSSLEPSVGVVSGLYVDSNGYPVAGELQPDGGYLPLAQPPTQVSEVDVVGAGFLLIPRETFEKIPGGGTHAFDHVVHSSGKVLGEDVSFCTRVKAAGLKILLDPEIYLGHLKVRRIYPDGTALP